MRVGSSMGGLKGEQIKLSKGPAWTVLATWLQRSAYSLSFECDIDLLHGGG